EEVGEDVGGKLHTAKSRNDQVSTAIRMVLREEILEIQELIADFVGVLVERAGENTETVIPGYTHLQVAEPTTFGHYLAAYGQTFVRDLKRLNASYEETNRCPLGACAFAGTSFPIDRSLTSAQLGFDGILENTMDAVGSRDFALQTMSGLAILMTNLSRLCEELVLWSSSEFDMIEIPDEFSTTSSIMPQKKNPEIIELGRAKSGSVIGDLVGGLNIVKGLPQAYDLDLQELTPLLWNSVDQVKSTLLVMRKLVSKLEPKPENMYENAERGFATLTELANTLVRETDVPFRRAHKIVGKLASIVSDEGKSLGDLTLEDLLSASREIVGEEVEISEDQFEEALDLHGSVESRRVVGGPSSDSVEEELSKLEKKVSNYGKIIEKRRDSLDEAKEMLLDLARGG
ncbi:hypothetical protein AKJ57_01660, partial [candidate division MSBL1 archaeon SCGC-AAA259A05]